jgi:hypothetical protein
MEYARLGNSGLIVSRLSFGVMTFGQGEGPMAAVSKTDEQTDHTTALPPLYPNWVHAATLDQKTRQALGA